MDRVLRERVGIGLAEAERWDVRRFFRGSGWDDAFPADRMLPALRGTLAGPRDRPRRAAQRPPRRRGAPDQEPARVLRPDRDPGQGDARDPAAGRAGRLVRALPRGRPHRALRLHRPEPEDGGEAARRQRGHRGLGDALRPPDRRPRLALEHAQLPAAGRLRGRGSGAAPLLRPPLLREAALRDRVPRGAGRDPDAQPLRRDPRRRAQGRAEPDGLPRRHRLRLLRDVVPPRLGVLGADDELHARGVRDRLVQAPRGRLAARRALARSARSRTPTSC